MIIWLVAAYSEPVVRRVTLAGLLGAAFSQRNGASDSEVSSEASLQRFDPLRYCEQRDLDLGGIPRADRSGRCLLRTNIELANGFADLHCSVLTSAKAIAAAKMRTYLARS